MRKEMIRKIQILSISSLFIISMFSTIALSQQLSTTSSEWTVMIYLNGDNKLSAAQIQELQLIKNVGSTEQVILTVLIDGDQEGDTEFPHRSFTKVKKK